MSMFSEEIRKTADGHPQNEFGQEGRLDLAGARAAIVNRTHRVVRQRAAAMQERRTSARSLVLPLLICSALLLMLCYAVSTVVSGTAFGAMDSVGTELQDKAGKFLTRETMDTGGPVYLLLLWFLPISAVTLAMVLFRRLRSRADDEVVR